jgi:glutamate formiminotransferase/formiminotetrahydrofolate cyclodeaminase
MRQIVQCAPNFSEGRREEVIQRLVATIEATDAQVLDVQHDPDLNRCVINFVGEIDAVERAAYAAAEVAAELIDMEQHEGEHPRIGATDVVPFIPVAGVALGDCVALARRVGERLGRELGIPVYLYGEAASSPERVPLSSIRRYEYEDMRDTIAHQVDLRPDFGPQAIGSAGAVAVGARHPIVALNVFLGTPLLHVADSVSRALREDSGGLRHVTAESVELPERGEVAVAVTVRRPDQTPLHRVFEAIRSEAARHGTNVVSSELVGMVPQSALTAAAQWYLQLNEVASDQIVESRLVDILSAAGEPKRAPRDFADAVASESPSPGAMGVAALAGALAAALDTMVANLTIGRDQYAAIEGEMRNIRDNASGLQAELLGLVQADAESYEEVMAAHGLPRATPDETEHRRMEIQKALLRAVEVPIATMRSSVEVLQLARRAAEVGNIEAVGEAGVAGLLAHAAVRAASIGVEVTVRGLRDLEEGDSYRKVSHELVGDAKVLAADVERIVQTRMAG